MSQNFMKIRSGITLAPQATDPTVNVNAGDLYYNSASNTFRYYNGSSWEAVGSGTGGILPKHTRSSGRSPRGRRL